MSEMIQSRYEVVAALQVEVAVVLPTIHRTPVYLPIHGHLTHESQSKFIERVTVVVIWLVAVVSRCSHPIRSRSISTVQ